MCKLKSAIVLKDRIFMPDYDSHSEMLQELGIEDNYFGASKKFVRVELSPEDGDPFSDIDSWVLRVDQDIVPDWYSEELYKPQIVEAVKEWAKTHIHINVDGLKISSGKNHYVKGGKDIEISGSASVKSIYGNASVESIYDSASVESISGDASVKSIYDSASVESISGSASVKSIYGNASVKSIYDRASVESIYDRASVKSIYGDASVKSIYDSASVESIYDNASVKYIYGDASVESIFDRASVKSIFDDASVESIFDRASVKSIYGDASVEYIFDRASVITSKYGWKNIEKCTMSDDAVLIDRFSKKIYLPDGFETCKHIKDESK